MTTRRKAAIAFSVLLLAIIAVCLAMLAYKDARTSNNIMGAFLGGAHDSQYEDSENLAFPNIDWQYWKSVNKDIIGWISVKNTKINYPILQADESDPSYYLEHDIYGNANEEGCIFLDAECASEGLESKNSVVFGHHLIEGRGFSAFADYSDQSYASANDIILLQTPDWQKALKVLFVEVTRGDAQTKVTSFESDEQFRLWLKQRYEASCVKLEEKIQNVVSVQRIWTFCTCSYTTYENERTLVYAAEMTE